MRVLMISRVVGTGYMTVCVGLGTIQGIRFWQFSIANLKLKELSDYETDNE